MTSFKFGAAINIRAYGEIKVEAESIEAAKALIATDGFDMKKHFSPNGGGDDDYEWNHTSPDIWLSYLIIDDEGDGEDLCEALPTNYVQVTQ